MSHPTLPKRTESEVTTLLSAIVTTAFLINRFSEKSVKVSFTGNNQEVTIEASMQKSTYYQTFFQAAFTLNESDTLENLQDNLSFLRSLWHSVLDNCQEAISVHNELLALVEPEYSFDKVEAQPLIAA